MGSVSNPRTWVPYVNTKDCSLGFCSMYCPQWCYIIFPPPPPPFDFPDDDSSPSFSPLVIAVIGILASAFLLVSYYAIISKYCKNRDSSRRLQGHISDGYNRDPSDHGQWNAPANGLDDALIRSITVFKYKKGDGLTEGTDCSICLSEFNEDESLRLLPKCSHAFHAFCIDAWLKSHPNCPLCRADIAYPGAAMPRELPPPVMEATPLGDEISMQRQQEINNNNVEATTTGDIEVGSSEQETEGSDHHRDTSTAVRAQSEVGRDSEIPGVVEIEVRRSVSMDNPIQGRVSIIDILRGSDDEEEEDYERESQKFQADEVGTLTRHPAGDSCSCSTRNKASQYCATSPVAMKRSFSSGRLMFPKRGRGRNSVIPL